MKGKKLRILLSLLLIITLFPLSACSGNSSQKGNQATGAPTVTVAATPVATAAPTPTAAAEETVSGGFTVDGTKLYDANGNEFIMRGVNQSYTWFKSFNNIALEAIAATGANTVRLVLSDGQKYQEDYLLYVKNLIEDCKNLKMIAILEVHDATGSNSVEDLNQAVDYWIRVKDALIGNEAYVIVNIANEWYGNWGGQEWADAYCAAIPKLREAGIENTILVDSAGWGQYAKSIHDFGTQVFEADPLANTMFAIHMYGSAGKNAAIIKSNIDGVRDLNLCVTIGEFGYKHSDGDVDEAYIMSYCQEIGVGYLGWSWKGNGGGVEYLDIATEWDGSKLSSDWGENLINGENGIRETSKICSVFE
jgi:mannan endo-1,4-beta-mannosidase